MNDFLIKENRSINLDRLDAQRHLYSKAKCRSYVITILYVLIPVVLAVTKILKPNVDTLIKGTLIYSFIVLLLKVFLNAWTESCKNLAARIQQQFDCDVFGFDWDEPLCGKQPTLEEIHNAKTGKSRDKLANWYESPIEQLDRISGIVVCQRTNIVYDKNLRSVFKKYLLVISVLSALLIFFVGVYQNNNVWDWFLNIVIPVSPLLAWYYDLYSLCEKGMSALNNLETLVSQAMTKLQNGGTVVENEVVRIQNFIFLHRKSAYTIPDFVYKIKRKHMEAATRYSVSQLVDILK